MSKMKLLFSSVTIKYLVSCLRSCLTIIGCVFFNGFNGPGLGNGILCGFLNGCVQITFPFYFLRACSHVDFKL